MILKNSKIGVSSDELSVRSLIYFIMELQNLFKYIGNYLLEIDETIAVAESVTSGFLQFSFSQMKDASKFYKGGITAYTPDEKVRLLQVDESEALACDCVSPNIAETMALNISKIFKTDWSIAVTGYATPVTESKNKLYAYFAIVYKGQVILSEKLDLHSRTKQVNAQLYYTEFILGCFKLELDKHREKRSIS
ncbi:nicotinamide-nucleotide amidohydrolase family protein [Chryseobacterium shandongense]|uniref:Nicotinamide-nucleotide amidohydrolase family protein n=1 Tax=Chryseobacterium shandongense TaxID=1493872 RepID=A0AAD1DKF0_9FLAO|nr:nicotinamide-nucleotide amidohydrolase family protein [Chryseobacterium shandongense]AZA85521.1 nicotinamide-nucleotide amidohydrolase family protein [Chryseobacterium shandongense]AZA97693.1 nicotinamide-nucleotide amidohydrolase family protein [Chryseobacterium shandongense]